MIKIIFFDVDGTLISKQNPIIKEDVISALKHLREKGIYLIVATGRHKTEIDELKLEESFVFDGYLYLNGGYCVFNDTVIYENKLAVQDVEYMQDYINNHDLACLYVERDEIYLNRVNQNVIDAQASIHSLIPQVKTVSDFNELYQINPFVGESELEGLLSGTKESKATSWHEKAYDVIPMSSGKKAGIEILLKHLQLTKEESMAFGDGENDIDMFQTVGYPIAMKNASCHVKSYACYICGDIDEEGILDGLKQFYLI